MDSVVGWPCVGDREELHELLDDILDRNRLTNNGPLVLQFEEELRQFLGVEYVVACSSGTAALQIALCAAGAENGEVIMPAWTSPATAQAAAWIGMQPVFADAGRDHNIDPKSVEDRLSNETVALIGVNLWGRLCDVAALEKIGHEEGIPVIIDGAHSFGHVSGGDVEVYSFHATKIFNTFEGGAVITNNPEIGKRAAAMRQIGYENGRVVSIGTNAKMSEIHAAMGLVNLRAYPSFVDANINAYRTYYRRLPILEAGVNYQYVVIELWKRDECMAALAEIGVQARDHFSPGCHKLLCFEETRCPVTDELAKRTLVLPTVGDIDAICDVVEKFL